MTWCLAAFLEPAEDAGGVAQQQRIPPGAVPRGAGLPAGASLGKQGRNGCFSRAPLTFSDLFLLTWHLVEVPSQEPGQDADLPSRRGAEGTECPCLASTG